MKKPRRKAIRNTDAFSHHEMDAHELVSKDPPSLRSRPKFKEAFVACRKAVRDHSTGPESSATMS
jgi:hypothetical protein